MFSKINNLYWHIRYNRNKSIKRPYYRHVADEKKRLIESGDIAGLKLLLCYLFNCGNEKRIIHSIWLNS